MKRLVIIFCCLFFSSLLQLNAQKCPHNFFDCRGACGWYIDKDSDTYCDYSAFTNAVWQKLTARKDSISQIALLKEKQRLDSIEAATHPKKNVDVNKQTSIKEKIENNVSNTSSPPSPHQCSQQVGGRCPQRKTCANAQQNIGTSSETLPLQAPVNAFKPKRYDILLISFSALILYLLTTFLANRKVIRKQTHRRIWNMVLLLTFLVSGVLGLLLAVQINYHMGIDWYQDLLFLHVEFGIGMAIVSIFHVLWHVRYFVNMFRKSKREL